MSRNNDIHEFNPVIYPFRLWVGINPSFGSVSERFYTLTPSMERIDFTRDIYHGSRFAIASTFPVCDKVGGWIGTFIPIYRPSMLTVGTIAHEASHCTDFMCDQFGVAGFNFNDGEARAYFTEWVANCINKVKMGKLK